MVMTSHIDSDHITGTPRSVQGARPAARRRAGGVLQDPDALAQLVREAARRQAGGGAVGNGRRLARRRRAAARARPFTAAVVSSVPQGNQLRKAATQLAVPINQGAGGDPVAAPARGQKVVPIADGLTFTILAPNAVQLKRLKDAFEAAKAEHGANDAAVGADYLNNTVPNMSSIVVIAEVAGAEGQEAPDASLGRRARRRAPRVARARRPDGQRPLPFRSDESAAPRQQPQHHAGLLRDRSPPTAT